jgi:altronate hydrolase
VATRNYIGILTSVNCSATVARAIADYFRRDVHPEELADYPNVDGIVSLTHGGGCGIDSMGPAIKLLRRTLAGYAIHPNFHSVLMIGLGCEANQISGIMAAHGLDEGEHIRVFTIQDTGGTTRTVARGIELIREMLPAANRVTRTTVPASHLVVGLQCGGSDGYSGISATRRWGPRWIGSPPTGGPPSFRRRRRYTARSTC